MNKICERFSFVGLGRRRFVSMNQPSGPNPYPTSYRGLMLSVPACGQPSGLNTVVQTNGCVVVTLIGIIPPLSSLSI